MLGQDVFFNTPIGVTYLGTEWAANPVVRSDLKVSHFLYVFALHSNLLPYNELIRQGVRTETLSEDTDTRRGGMSYSKSCTFENSSFSHSFSH